MRAAANAQTFDFYPLRFRFAASKLRDFSANTVRGQFGSALKKVDRDAYSRFFAPRAASGPSGFADPPRPFVFRAFGPLEVGLNLFLTREPAIELFTQVMTELGTLTSVSGTERLGLPLCARDQPIDRVRVRFLTVTELKGAGQPEFGVLLARIRDRVSTLRELYGDGPLVIDFKAFGERASRVSMTRCELTPVAAERVSRRTGQRHSLGGFTGLAEYEGDLAEFVPYLEIARWTGVGRQTVWGKGEIAYETL
ncbi:MAG TPA: CRISPR system precrRNA processing endoribonuclease RAMP protein Cas6 [Bryobacteraceae bacterium]|nr:CRISPR system precrRNA processing endoribonuclease RAMP protein Cas6 [Bryobacteraceae bacterium]